MATSNTISISKKLPAILVMIATVAIACTSLIATYEARKWLMEESKLRLATIAAGQAERMDAWLTDFASDITTQAQTEWLREAMQDIDASWRAQGLDATKRVLRLYVSGNPHPPGARDLLEDAGDGSPFSIQHAKIHADFRSILESKGYYDVFLINPEGDIVYTVEKEVDFGSNLVSGPWHDTGLASVWRDSLNLNPGESALADFSAYSPSNGAAALFMATPINNPDGKQIGTLAIQLPVGAVRAMIGGATGLGESGEVYIVGSDLKLRTDLRREATPTALGLRVDTEAVRRALEGESGIVEGKGLGGRNAVSAFHPLPRAGVIWAVIAEQDLAEVLAPAQAMTRLILTASATVLLITGLVSYFLSRSLTTPILALAGAIERLDSRQLDTAIPHLDRGDELGLISRGLDRLRSNLASGRIAERENQFRGAALENASAPLMIMDADFVVTYANPAVLHLLREHASSFRLKIPNFDPERIIGQPMDSFHAAPAKVRRVIEDPANLPYTADIAVGDERFALTVSHIPDGSGSSLGYVLEWEHVTIERMNAALLGTLDRTQAKAIFSRTGALLQVNENFASALGLEVDRLTSYGVQDLLAQKTDQEDWMQALKGNACFKKFNFTAQQTAILEGSLSPIVDRTGTITRVAFLGVDITEASARLKKAEFLREQMVADQMRVVTSLSESLDRLSQGDLSFEISDAFAAEYEALRLNFNTTLAKLNRAMTTVVENATAISLEAAEVSSASSELGLRTERQAATLEQTAAALDELTTSVSSAAEAAANAQSVASDTRAKAEIARATMKDAIVAMNSISQSSEQIRRINSVIDDIAFQTNLLALNAGVEAARAGPAGRGFAVVASEVRALAQRATEAAREIGQLIDMSSEQVSGGVDRVHEVGRSLAKMIEAFGIVSDRITTIAASAREQSVGLHEINRSLAELDQTTQQNAAMFEETMAASVALTRNAQNLEATMMQFRVNGIIVPKDRSHDSESNRAA